MSDLTFELLQQITDERHANVFTRLPDMSARCVLPWRFFVVFM